MTKLVRRSMLVGLGAALLLSSSAHAQQSVNPSFFLDLDPVAAGVEQEVQQGLTQDELNLTQNIERNVEQGLAEIDALQIAQDTGITMQLGIESKVATAILGNYTPGEESDLKELKLMDTLLVWSLVAGTGLIALYANAITRGERIL
jgi:hypothetical protein